MALNFNFTEPGYVPSSNFNFGASVTTYNILAGQSKVFTSIWADPTANINNAKLYVGTSGSGAAFSIVDLGLKRLIDNYRIDYEGENKEFLDREDIVDINVSTAGA
jgi:hypothetical protein